MASVKTFPSIKQGNSRHMSSPWEQTSLVQNFSHQQAWNYQCISTYMGGKEAMFVLAKKRYRSSHPAFSSHFFCEQWWSVHQFFHVIEEISMAVSPGPHYLCNHFISSSDEPSLALRDKPGLQQKQAEQHGPSCTLLSELQD